MRVTLIHNPGAGEGAISSRAQMVSDLGAFGWKANVVDNSDWEQALRDPGDAVVVAGGDGTVARVAKRLAGTGIPVAVIPTGTANNVARSLGIGLDVPTALQSLRSAIIREVDLGVVRTAGDAPELFIEGFGVGLFAWVMAERATERHKALPRAFGLIARELEAYEPCCGRLELDGRVLSGEYLLVAVMNLRSLGPALDLAPDACLDDGWLDVVIVRPEHRAPLIARFRRAAVDGALELPRFEIHRAEHVRLSGHGRWAHIDDGSRALASPVDIHVQPHVARFLVPSANG